MTTEQTYREDYVPFGEEWEKYLMKLPKKFIIDMLRKANIARQQAEALSQYGKGEPEQELSSEEWDDLIKTHIERMWGGLEMASVQYFMETGKVNGSFRLRLISLMKFHQWKVDGKGEETGSKDEEKGWPFQDFSDYPTTNSTIQSGSKDEGEKGLEEIDLWGDAVNRIIEIWESKNRLSMTDFEPITSKFHITRKQTNDGKE